MASILDTIEEPGVVGQIGKQSKGSILDTIEMPEGFKDALAPSQEDANYAISLDANLGLPKGFIDKLEPLKTDTPKEVNDPYDVNSLMGQMVPKVPTKKEAKPNEPISFRQGEEPSFVSNLINKSKELFTSKTEEAAKATYKLVLANELGVKPSEVDPDLVDAFRSGYGDTPFGLISQIERGTKYPKVDVRGMNAIQRGVQGLGGVAGSFLPFAAGSLAGVEGGPIGMLAAGFAIDKGLRAYYSYKLDKGEINSPEEFIEVLKTVIPETIKGEITGAATGKAGAFLAPLGKIASRIGEAVTMSNVGSWLEGKLASPEEIFDSAILLVGLHSATKTANVARNIKKVWVETGRRPKDIVEDAKTDSETAEALNKEGEIPEEVLAKAQAKVDALEKLQAELAVREAAAKNPIEPEELVKEDLKIKGKRVKEIKEGKAKKAVEPVEETSSETIPTETVKPEVKSVLDTVEEPVKKDRSGTKRTGKKKKEVITETEVIAKTKSKPSKPITEIDTQTGTSLPKELSPSEHPFRDKDKAHTDTMNKLYVERIKHADVDPEVFTRYLINEVNRWLNGDEPSTPIEKIRNGLRSAVTNAENVRLKFDTRADFENWRATVSEASRWASEAVRSEPKRTNEIKFMIGVDPTEIKKVLDNIKYRLVTRYSSDDTLSTSGYIFNDGKTVNLTTKIPGGYKSIPHEDALFQGLNEFDAKIVYKVLGGEEEQLAPYLKESGTVRYIRENNNTLSIQVGQVLSLNQLEKIKNNLRNQDTVYLDMPGKSTTVKVSQLDSTINNHFNQKVSNKLGETLYMGIDPTDPKIIAYARKLYGMAFSKLSIERQQGIIKHFEFEAQLKNIKKTPIEKLEDRLNLLEERIEKESNADNPNDKLIKSLEAERDQIQNKIDSFDEGGIQLNMGLDPTQLPKEIKDMFKNAAEFFKGTAAALDMKKFDLGYAIKEIKGDIVQAGIDQQETLLKEVRRLYPKESQRIIDRQRSAVNGKGYGEIEYNQMMKEVFDGKSSKQVGLINDYLLARRFKDIYSYRTTKEYKHQPEFGPNQAVAVTATMEMIKDLPEGAFAQLAKIPELKKRFEGVNVKDVADAVNSGNIFFEWMRKVVDDLVEAGIKTETEGIALKAHDFRKFKTISIEKLYDFDYQSHLKGETIRSTNSGVQSLGHGSTKIIDPDARVSAHEMFVRAYGSIANQAAKVQWKNLAEQHPDNAIVSIRQKSGWSPMPYFEGGVKKEIYFSPEAAKYMITRSHDISQRASTISRTIFMAPLTRTLAVGASPIWSTFIGLPMDVIHSLWTAKVWEADAKGIKLKPDFPFYETTTGAYKRVYSAYNPLTPLQIGLDMSRTLGDIYTRGPLFKNLAKHGLAMPLLSMRENRYLKGARPPGDWAKLMDIVSYHGVSMETWVRAATADRVIRERANEKGISYEGALKNDDIMYEAVHSARDRMDYNQGGWMIKAIDTGIGLPFLNAAVLGTRTFWRSAIENPVDFGVRAMQLTMAAAGITAMAWSHHEDVMKDIPTEGNEKNVIFPLFPDWINFKDENGDTRYLYAKLRMDPGPAFMYKMADNLTRTYLYDREIIKKEPDYNKVVDSLKTLGPVGMNLPPTAQMGVDYATNYSWWKGRQMYNELGGRTLPWPKSKHEGESDSNIAQLAKDVGGVTGFSPPRLQGSISNVIPYNNEFVYMFGKAYKEAFSDVPESDRKVPLIESLAKVGQFFRVIGMTVPGYSRGQVRNQVQEELDLENIVKNGKFEQLAKDYAWKGIRKRDEVIDYINSQKDKNDYENMKEELEFMEKTKDLEHRGTWVGMWHMNAKGKAKEFARSYMSSTDKEKEQLRKELIQIEARFRTDEGESAGYVSDSFKEYLMQQEFSW